VPALRFLLIEDDDILGSAVCRHLERSGFVVDWIRRGSELRAALSHSAYAAALLDLRLPDCSGEALLAQMKRDRPGLPVVVATARGAINDRISLLDVGADDYLVKPFDLDELSARLRAVTRRTMPARKTEVELTHGRLTMQPTRRTVTWCGQPVPLSNKEFLLLESLLRRKNQVLTRAQLEHTLFSNSDEIGSNALEVYVHFLRRKFGRALIQTVRGIGYQLGDGARLVDR
jgi:DNA-binding response OmpR family regulator